MATPALRFALALPLVFAPGLIACDSGNDHGHDETAGETHDGHGETHGQADCADETRDDEFAIGLSKSSESATVSFVAADPAPPAIDDNTWTVQISDPDGQPLTDASITTVTPMMPDHGHGTPSVATVTATGNPAEFEISPVNMFMAGLWEVTLDIDLGGGTTEQVVFAFCVE